MAASREVPITPLKLGQLLIGRGVEILNMKRKKVPKLDCSAHYSENNKIILKNALKYSKNMVTNSEASASRSLGWIFTTWTSRQYL